jgi:hypothetical protein
VEGGKHKEELCQLGGIFSSLKDKGTSCPAHSTPIFAFLVQGPTILTQTINSLSPSKEKLIFCLSAAYSVTLSARLLNLPRDRKFKWISNLSIWDTNLERRVKGARH